LLGLPYGGEEEQEEAESAEEEEEERGAEPKFRHLLAT